jgi:hypothetical protein
MKLLMLKKIDLRFSVLSAIIMLAVCSRLIPHPANFSPLAAIALFGAAYFSSKRYALCIPLLATWLSDLYINNVVYKSYYPNFTWFYEGSIWTYLSYVLIGIWGMFVFKSISVKRIFAGALGATTIFFLVSNLGCMQTAASIPSFKELWQVYVDGFPYLTASMLGDLCYSLMIFGCYHVIEHQFPIHSKV